MKIIFLDFDGVLNNHKWLTRKDRINLKWPIRDICPDNVKALNRITELTGAKIVITSTWRLGHTDNGLRELFNEAGITGEMVGQTAVLDVVSGQYDLPRGCEIDQFIQTMDRGLVDTYVILDDDADMLYKQRDNFIQVNGKYGLTADEVLKAIDILNKED